jgi:hypothetical protein
MGLTDGASIAAVKAEHVGPFHQSSLDNLIGIGDVDVAYSSSGQR